MRRTSLIRLFAVGCTLLILALLWTAIRPADNPRLFRPKQYSLAADSLNRLRPLPSNAAASNPALAKLIDPKRHVDRALNTRTESIPPVRIQATAETIFNKMDELKEKESSGDSKPLSGLPRGQGKTVVNPEQQKAVDRLLETLGPEADLQMDNVSGTVRFLEGDLEKVVRNSEAYQEASRQKDFGKMAVALADEIKQVMNLRQPEEELASERVKTDELGMTHVMLQQRYQDEPIWGAQIGIHFDKEGNPYQISGVYPPTPAHLPRMESQIPLDQAVAAAKKAVNMEGEGLVPIQTQKMIYWDIDKASVACYRVDLVPAIHEYWQIFVSRSDGSIVHRYNAACYAAAVGRAKDLFGREQVVNCWQDGGSYLMIDTTKPMYDAASSPPTFGNIRGGVIVFDMENQVLQGQFSMGMLKSNNINTWDPAGVSVLYHYELVEKYYRSTFARNSIDDRGLNIVAAVHARFPSQSAQGTADNAVWNGGMLMMFFGDGGERFGKMASALDVTGHELTHGVIQFTADLIYENQSGALNEHVADFFGCMVDRDDWLQGEDITPGKLATRDMQNPDNPQILSAQPGKFSDYRNLPNDPKNDNGGVHVNSGIPNRMSYLLCDGPEGVGKAKGEKIIYRALSQYLNKRSQFIDYRRACVSAARDLFGENSAEGNAVKKAFDGVEITDAGPGPGDGGSQNPTPGQPTQGQEATVFLAADPQSFNGQDYSYNLYLENPQGLFLVTERTVANTRPAVSGDGQWGLYVDKDHNMWWSNGGGQDVLWVGDSSIRTIAMTKDQKYLAYTTADFSNTIHLLDTQTRQVRQAPLKFTDTNGGTIALVYADVLSFNFRGDYLIFDGVIKLQLGNNQEAFSWGIYSLRLVDLQVQSVTPILSGMQFGNPAMAHTSDHNLLVDVIEGTGNQTRFGMASVDFLANAVSILPVNLPDVGQPTFRGDDTKAVFRTFDPAANQFLLVNAVFTPDKTKFVENSLQSFINSVSPLSYPVGFREGQYTPQEGRISVPPSLAFGDTPVGSEQVQTLAIANQGNGDINILEISVDGQAKNAYEHNGINQVIAAGKALTFQVRFHPPSTGVQNAFIRIRSTETEQAEVTVQLRGNGLPAVDLPSPTSVPNVPTVTPTPPVGPLPSPTPGSSDPLSPLVVYEFDKSTLDACGWKEIPGGFQGRPNGSSVPITFFGRPLASSKDNRGLMITVNPNEVAFVHPIQAIHSTGAPVLIKARLRADSANASIVLGSLRGNFNVAGTVDGSIGLVFPQNAGNFINDESGLTMLYQPDDGGFVTPLIQVAHSGSGGPVNVMFDRVEVYLLKAGSRYAGSYFQAK